MNCRSIIAATLIAGASLSCGVSVSAAGDTEAARHAVAQARTAGKALAKHEPTKAVAAAEAAVAMSPRTAAYRTLLGQAYLASGRFPSAVAALNDALSLDPSDGAAALHLALAKIGIGDWSGARETLIAHEATIPAGDRGLAFALAGDPVTAVSVLTDAARTPGATAKTRQNLALALGLAGRWQDAKTVAAFDVAPGELDKRLMQWMAFARPSGAADQVAALLGVSPIEDAGQPARLALNAGATAVAAVAEPAPVAVAAPVEPVAVAPVKVAAIVFAPRQEVVQPLPMTVASRPVVAAVKRDYVVKVSRPAAATSGSWFVQLGAYDSVATAQAAWTRMSRRHRVLSAQRPQGMSVSTRGGSLYRLSVGGFARTEANAVCRSVQQDGGRCYVRTFGGDALAAWLRSGVQVAAR
ncbi:SPOR domain-containing protein [Sphingomonas sp. RS2018]